MSNKIDGIMALAALRIQLQNLREQLKPVKEKKEVSIDEGLLLDMIAETFIAIKSLEDYEYWINQLIGGLINVSKN